MKTSFCRLCSETESSVKHFNLDADEETLQEIKIKLKMLNLVCDLSNYEHILNNVCCLCYNSLNEACEFIEKVKRAETKIFKLLTNNKLTSDKNGKLSTCSEVDDIKPLLDLDQDTEDFKHQYTVSNFKQNVDWSSYLWMCSECSMLFENVLQLRKHSVQEHGICCTFTCTDCMDYFNSFETFTDHVRDHRPNLRYYCKYCNIFYPSYQECTSHEKWHIENFDICQSCGECFVGDESLSVLSIHKKVTTKPNHTKTKVKRTESDDASLSSLNLDNNVANSHSIPPKEIQIETWKEYPWICRSCLVAFSTVFKLRAHMKAKHNICAALKCLDCKDRFNDRTFDCFLQHIGTHRKNLSTICFYCNRQKLSISELRLHVKKQHLINFYCKKCGEEFRNEHDLQNHLKLYSRKKTKHSETTVEDRTCKVCQKVMKSTVILRVHFQRTHLGKKNIICEQCGLSFDFNNQFEIHKLTVHENERFQCKLCDKTFLRKNSLRKHIRWHSSEKPYSCEVCGVSFKLKSILNNHRTIHLNAKPFACQYCQKTFRLKLFLKRHEVIHTGLKPYSCKICNVAYANRENCYNHMKRKHNIQRSKPNIEMEFDEDAKNWKNNLINNCKRGRNTPKDILNC